MWFIFSVTKENAMLLKVLVLLELWNVEFVIVQRVEQESFVNQQSIVQETLFLREKQDC